MEIFISWSGKKSKALASILHDWLPGVIQAVKPYFTPEDLLKGTKWSTEISKKLDTCKIGIICLTSENYNAPWILFEAGALSKHIDQSHVCPILFDLDPANITGPLINFQFTLFNKEDIKLLVKMINTQVDDNPLDENTLDKVFEMWWPKLAEMVGQELSKKEINKDKAIKRPDRELLEELLELTRQNSRAFRSSRSFEINPTALKDLVNYYKLLVENIETYYGIEMLQEPLKEPLKSLFTPIAYIVSRHSENPEVREQLDGQLRKARELLGDIMQLTNRERVSRKKLQDSAALPEEEK